MNFRRAKPDHKDFRLPGADTAWSLRYHAIVLVKPATGRPVKGEWDHDEWLLSVQLVRYGENGTIAHPLTGPVESFTYKTGTGHRTTQFGKRAPYQPRGMTVSVWESLIPTAPDMPGFLESIASDVSTAIDMPAAETDAMDYLAEELGMTEGKPSDILRTVRALQDVRTKVARLVKPSGMTESQFIDWARESE